MERVYDSYVVNLLSTVLIMTAYLAPDYIRIAVYYTNKLYRVIKWKANSSLLFFLLTNGFMFLMGAIVVPFDLDHLLNLIQNVASLFSTRNIQRIIKEHINRDQMSLYNKLFYQFLSARNFKSTKKRGNILTRRIWKFLDISICEL